MDKTLVNHQIVSMRKHVRISKRHVLQKLFKQINLIKKKIEKWQNLNEDSNKIESEKLIQKFQKKLQTRQNEVMELKQMNQDLISKQALIHDTDYFNSIINKSDQASSSDRLVALVCLEKSVQNIVNRFKQDNPDCDQWLPSQIELWDQKEKKTAQKSKGKKTLSSKKTVSTSKQSISKIDKMNGESKAKSKSPRSYTPKFAITEMETENSTGSSILNNDVDNQTIINNKSLNKNNLQSKKAVIKRIDFNSIESNKILSDDENDEDESENDNDENGSGDVKTKSSVDDDFFVSENGDEDLNDNENSDDEEDDQSDNDDEEEDDEEEELVHPKFRNKSERSFFKGKSGQINSNKRKNFPNDNNNSYRNRNNNNNSFQKNFSRNGKMVPKRFSNGEGHQSVSAANIHKPNQSRDAGDDNLHPSWKAKKAAKVNQKIDLSKPTGKKIKFD